MKSAFVLDAWAILALLQREEPAASRVRQLLELGYRGEIGLHMSIINLGEVIYRVGKVQGERQARETLDQIKRLPLTIMPASEDAVFAAVTWKMHHAISYADAFAAATAAELNAVLVTGDPELGQLDQVRIEMLKRRG